MSTSGRAKANSCYKELEPPSLILKLLAKTDVQTFGEERARSKLAKVVKTEF